MSAHEAMPIIHTAACGTRFVATFRQSWCPGTARSRENAKSILEAEVHAAVRQNICAITAMNSSASAQFWLIDCDQICVTANAPASSTDCVDGIANVTARRRTQPKTIETNTDIHMPTAAALEAWCVSSAMCADAS